MSTKSSQDHDKAIADAARSWAANVRKNGLDFSHESKKLLTAVGAEEKAKEPALLSRDDGWKIYCSEGCGPASIASVLLEAHKRAAARAEWVLRNEAGSMTCSHAAFIIRRALTE